MGEVVVGALVAVLAVVGVRNGSKVDHGDDDNVEVESEDIGAHEDHRGRRRDHVARRDPVCPQATATTNVSGTILSAIPQSSQFLVLSQ